MTYFITSASMASVTASRKSAHFTSTVSTSFGFVRVGDRTVVLYRHSYTLTHSCFEYNRICTEYFSMPPASMVFAALTLVILCYSVHFSATERDFVA